MSAPPGSYALRCPSRSTAAPRRRRQRRNCWSALSLILPLAFPACQSRESGNGQPNIVLISLDTLRADHLELYGYHRRTAPALQRLAAESVVFDSTFSQAPKTAPSHMTLLTGLLPDVHGVRNLEEKPIRGLPEGIPTLASLLSSAGYHTAALTDGGHMTSALGFDRGFDSFVEGAGTVDIAFRRAAATAAALSVREQPFFLFVHTYAIHDPYAPPQRFQIFNSPTYDGSIVGDRELLTELAGDEWSQQHEIYWNRVRKGNADDLQRLQDLYDAGILHTDVQVAHLLDELRAMGEYENSIIVVLSDHGEEFLEHGEFLHNSLYREILHVPLIVRFPESVPEAWRGLRITEDVGLVDVLPTLLDYLGLATSAELQGRSFLPLLTGARPWRKRPLLAHWPQASPVEQRAIQLGRWKLIENGRKDPLQLYDLASDPGERQDLASIRPVEVEELHALLGDLVDRNRSLRAGFGKAPGVHLSGEHEKQLRALGYLK